MVLGRIAIMRLLAALPLLFASSSRRYTCNATVLATRDEMELSMDGAGVASPLIDYGEDLGVSQYVDVDPERLEEILMALERSRQYLDDFSISTNKLQFLQEECKNKHRLCSLWSVMGECQKNQLYMNLTCAPMCHSCEYLLPEVRCPLDPNAVDAWQPGDLNRMFQRLITKRDFQRHKPTILSCPDKALSTKAISTTDSLNRPWIVQLEHFLSPDETNHLIMLAEEEGYNSRPIAIAEKSIDSSPSFSFCMSKRCVNDAGVRALMHRVERLTNIPEANYEHLEILQYNEGQFSEDHNNFVAQHFHEQQGVRLLTVFIYLSDVEKGGSTTFPSLNVTVTPQQGRALIFPSVLDEAPNSAENGTINRELQVVKGTKYAASLLIHQRDFKTPHAMHCVTL